MLGITFEEFVRVIVEEAEQQDPGGAGGHLDIPYLSHLTAGSIFPMMNTISSVLKPDYSTGDLAVMASSLAISNEHFQSGIRELRSLRKSDVTILKGVRPYDAATHLMFMVAFAWMRRDVPILARENPFDLQTMADHGLPEFVHATLNCLEVPYTAEEFAEKMRHALDLIITIEPCYWQSSFASFEYWDSMLPTSISRVSQVWHTAPRV